MLVLLVLNGSADHIQVLVNVRQKNARLKVIALLEENKEKEAFEFLKSRAQVEGYYPAGIVPDIKVQMTLVEDMCVG